MELRNIVGRFTPFHRTSEPVTKPLPLTVNVNDGLPATIELGTSAVIAGVGLTMLMDSAFDVPPPKPSALGGVTTVTLAVPAFNISVAGICAVACVAEITLVARGLPFHCTTDVLTKLTPVTVNKSPGSPALTGLGFKDVMRGDGGGGSIIVNGSALEVVPGNPVVPGGLNTVTLTIPAVVKSLEGMTAVNTVVETNVVARSAPFQRTTEMRLKFDPVTVSVICELPAVTEFGAILLRIGVGDCA